MIDLPVEQTKEPSAQARRFAALSGSFDPRTLRGVLRDASADVTLAVLADLADVCDTGHQEDRWLMRGNVRQREIDNLAAAGELEDAIAWRRSLPVDEATDDLLAALAGSGGFGEDVVRATIDRDADRDTLKRIAVALDRAGERAPAHAALTAVRSALGRLDMRDRADAMLSRGFFGRVNETDEIAAWLSRPIKSPPVTALFISGLPGIGKSTLVDEAARRAASATPPWILVRLDFDRSGLDVQDRVGLTMEIARQISIELGDTAADLRHARLLAAGATSLPDPDVKGERREHVPDELSRALGDAVRSAGRPILMILDTLEVLHGRAQTHPGRLFDCLDELCDRGLTPMAVIAAGRGDALEGSEKRIGHRIDLGGLDVANADALLTRLEVPSEAFPEIREIADGNPLVLRLAGLAVREAGPEALETARGRRELAAAYLYRFLLSRIGDAKLQALAEPGLVVRRINPDVIAEVLAPQLKVRLEPGEAVTLFERLATHHWLVEPDPTAPDGFGTGPTSAPCSSGSCTAGRRRRPPRRSTGPRRSGSPIERNRLHRSRRHITASKPSRRGGGPAEHRPACPPAVRHGDDRRAAGRRAGLRAVRAWRAHLPVPGRTAIRRRLSERAEGRCQGARGNHRARRHHRGGLRV